MARGRILIFVEDPGAANFIAPALDSLTAAGWQLDLSAAGLASTFLSDRGIAANAVPASTDASIFLKASGANLLMVGTAENPDTFAFPLTQAARKAGVPSIGFVDGPANAQHRFRGHDSDPLTHVTDWLILTDEHAANLFTALHHPRTRMAVTGHPYYDIVRAEAAQLRQQSAAEHREKTLGKAPADRPVIVFLGEGSDGLGMDIKRRSADYTLTGRGTSDRRTEIVLEEFLDAIDALDSDPYLIFRAHPKDPASGYEAYMDRFDAISEGGRPLQLLFAADLVVGLSTSLLVEAALAGLNTLSILPAKNQESLIPTVLQGLTPCATDRATLHKLLPRVLRNGVDDKRPAAPMTQANASAQVVEAVDLIAGHG